MNLYRMAQPCSDLPPIWRSISGKSVGQSPQSFCRNGNVDLLWVGKIESGHDRDEF
jgi:hypothetical protein